MNWALAVEASVIIKRASKYGRNTQIAAEAGCGALFQRTVLFVH
jgi:hypothetical protein